jgi:hypothetical protein
MFRPGRTDSNTESRPCWVEWCRTASIQFWSLPLKDSRSLKEKNLEFDQISTNAFTSGLYYKNILTTVNEACTIVQASFTIIT